MNADQSSVIQLASEGDSELSLLLLLQRASSSLRGLNGRDGAVLEVLLDGVAHALWIGERSRVQLAEQLLLLGRSSVSAT